MALPDAIAALSGSEPETCDSPFSAPKKRPAANFKKRPAAAVVDTAEKKSKKRPEEAMPAYTVMTYPDGAVAVKQKGGRQLFQVSCRGACHELKAAICTDAIEELKKAGNIHEMSNPPQHNSPG